MSNSSMKMVEKNLANITEDEAALYDRQIRLWGLDAQKRLRASRVLVAGVCGMGAEVTKNLVLSGIKSLTLLDHRNLTEIDVCANFLAPHDAVGQNIAEVSKERAQILNPMVEVSSDSDDIEKKTDEFFKQFDVVCAMRCSKEQLLRISNICHQNKILFFGGDVFGMIGYMFADLQEHQYVEEVKEKVEVEQDGKKQTVEETKMVKRTENFVPLSQALDVDWTTTKYASQLRRTSSTYFIMHIIMEFITLHGRNPNPAHRAEDEVELLTIKNALLEKMGIPQEKVDNQFASMVYGQLSPVCAIVGGVLAQEIIKAVSQKDPPHNNFFFFNTQDGAGVVECIGH
ncbi:SUMO-activating enzyme subunit 1-like isoform X2 [Penaeus chinensis]|uniref:SUMO-activating enzyme subunit 1-like isoform X2 n=1 Tax=Penaeus chinensis TaxID=139456 RepID=UPI001FB6EE40|nr:SUMO-activating enzyme subunit 1-like isoform X2 [Penaeus chinensis]